MRDLAREVKRGGSLFVMLGLDAGCKARGVAGVKLTMQLLHQAAVPGSLHSPTTTPVTTDNHQPDTTQKTNLT